MKTIALALATILISTSTQADIIVRFDEGAPKDQFTIENSGSCVFSSALVTIDLSESKAGLIFDVTGEGAGVEVFQPFEFVSGAKFVEKVPVVRDGDSSIDISIDSLASAQNVAFTIDVDDTMGEREITVSGSEIEGALVSLSSADKTGDARFGKDAVATLKAC